jgi:hypothetical protein
MKCWPGCLAHLGQRGVTSLGYLPIAITLNYKAVIRARPSGEPCPIADRTRRERRANHAAVSPLRYVGYARRNNSPRMAWLFAPRVRGVPFFPFSPSLAHIPHRITFRISQLRIVGIIGVSPSELCPIPAKSGLFNRLILDSGTAYC